VYIYNLILKVDPLFYIAAEDYSVCSPLNSANTNNNIRIRTSAGGSGKSIKSPLYPNKYPSNIKCTWYITASSSSRRIKLTISDVKIYNYNYSCSSYSSQDVLTIRDGSSSYSTMLKQMCSGNYSSTTVTSTGKSMWIQFKTNSDNYFTGSTAGFKIEYTEFDVSSSSKWNHTQFPQVPILYWQYVFIYNVQWVNPLIMYRYMYVASYSKHTHLFLILFELLAEMCCAFIKDNAS